MTHALALLPPVYLFIGCLIAQGVRRLSGDAITKREAFMVGLLWPVFLLVFLESLLLILIERRHG